MRVVVLVVLVIGCAPQVIDVDASAPDAPPIDASQGPPSLDDLCLASDPDAIVGLVANETVACTSGTATAPLFPSLPALPSDATRLHALCARMNPDAGTRDDLADAALAADLAAWLADVVTRPAMDRAFAGGPSDPAARVAAIESVWLPQNALEHVLCGELDPSGTGVWGLHLWSEYAQAETEGRAVYECTRAAIDTHDVATIRYRWQPEGRTAFAEKPIGSFAVGLSPACVLALGYVANARGLGSPSGASIPARVDGEALTLELVTMDGAIVTLYPTE